MRGALVRGASQVQGLLTINVNTDTEKHGQGIPAYGNKDIINLIIPIEFTRDEKIRRLRVGTRNRLLRFPVYNRTVNPSSDMINGHERS